MEPGLTWNFRKELEALINSQSLENGSDTPDFILATFLTECLMAFDKATNTRDYCQGREKIKPCQAKLIPQSGQSGICTNPLTE